MFYRLKREIPKAYTPIRGVLELSFFVDAPQEEAFQLVMDYFNGRSMKIVASNSPSYVGAEFGSWVALATSWECKGRD